VPAGIQSRLFTMMFLQYFAMGAVLPILSLYLKDYLGFSPAKIGYILAMPAVAAFTAPFIAAHVADRLISSERLMGLYHLSAACIMIVLALQRDWLAFLGCYLLHSLLFMPTSALSNAVALHHVPNAKRDFGGVRMWGTIGWLAVAWIFGYFYLRGAAGEADTSRLPHALFVSAIAGAILGSFLFTFPRASGREAGKQPGLGVRKAIVALSHPSLILFSILALFASITNTFYMQWMAPYLSQIGFAEEYILPILSLGQVSELVAMALLGRTLTAVGYKGAMMVGIGAQVLRFVVFAFFPEKFAVMAAISLHGISWTFFFTAGYIFVDHHSPKRDRAAVQQFYHMLLTGVGSLAGSIIAGQVAARAAESGTINFTLFWAVPAIVAGAVLLVLGVFFKEE
jgi:nucleoside transporter